MEDQGQVSDMLSQRRIAVDEAVQMLQDGKLDDAFPGITRADIEAYLAATYWSGTFPIPARYAKTEFILTNSALASANSCLFPCRPGRRLDAGRAVEALQTESPCASRGSCSYPSLLRRVGTCIRGSNSSRVLSKPLRWRDPGAASS